MGTDKEQYQGEPSDGLPQDQESDTEYDRAVAAPQSFTGKDLSKITTYDDLTGEMLSVGKGIQTIVGPGGTIEGSVLISKPYHGRATISASAEENLAFISLYSLQGAKRVEY